MDPRSARTPGPGFAPAPPRLPAVLAGVGGCLFLVAFTSPRDGLSLLSFLGTPLYGGTEGPLTVQNWLYLATPAMATVLGLCLLRWWPYLLVAAGLMAVPGVVSEMVAVSYPFGVYLLPIAAYWLALLALLGCAQGMIRTAVGWGAVIGALTVGSRLLGSVLPSVYHGWVQSPYAAGTWHIVLLAVGLVALVPAVRLHRRGDADAFGGADLGTGRRIRMIAVGIVAAAMPLPLSLLTTQHLADLLGVSWSALSRHNTAQAAAIGAIALVAVSLLAAVAGRWSLCAALVVALVHVAVVAPTTLAAGALGLDDTTRRLAALAGALLGAAAAGNRWRFPLAATLAVLDAAALIIAQVATTGDPEKLALQHTVIPGVLIMVLCAATASAVVGATATALAPRGMLPVVLGPLAGVLTGSGLSMMEPAEGLSDTLRLNTSTILLLVGGAAIGGLGFAQLLATRRAERKQAEQIRREAAAAERERLARPIHDGVLQVLALVQRHGSDLGDRGSQLAALAGEQEVALRSLLTSGAGAGRDAAEDLRVPLQALADSAIDIVAPAQPVALPAAAATEVVAAVRAALDNVHRHAGPGAHAWLLLEEERDGVRVTVRDDGIGFAPQRLAEAEAAGRLGVAQSMRGRIADLGGTTTIDSRPGEGTEVEFWVPRVTPAAR